MNGRIINSKVITQSQHSVPIFGPAMNFLCTAEYKYVQKFCKMNLFSCKFMYFYLLGCKVLLCILAWSVFIGRIQIKVLTLLSFFFL